MGIFKLKKRFDYEYITSDEFLNAIRLVMGSIDLDPFSSDLANEFVEATTYYTIKDDSMNPEKPWTGNVYVFPPNTIYSYNSQEGKYKCVSGYTPTMVGGARLAFKNLYKFYLQGHVNQAFYFTNNFGLLAVEQNVFKFPVCIVRGSSNRLYLNDGHELRTHKTGPVFFVYMPPKDNVNEAIQLFSDTFKCFGHIVT
jgi:hypothetical protein